MNWKSIQWKQIALPISLIVLVSVLVFLPFATQLGFYRDDWYMLWSANVRGADSIIDLFSIDRPFMGYTYDITYRLLGNSPLPWQIYSFALKTIGALAIYGIMRLIWPENNTAAYFTSLLYLIYPGYLSQPNAATMTNQLLSLTAELLSIWLTGLAVVGRDKGRRIGLIIISIFLGLLNFLLYEYMIGLEILRLCILWFIPRQNTDINLRAKLRRLIGDWWPYLIVLSGFLVWRLVIFKSDRIGTDQLSLIQTIIADFRTIFIRMGLQAFLDPLETLLFAWVVPFEQFATQEKPRFLLTVLFLGIVIMSISLVGIRLGKRFIGDHDEEKDSGNRALSVCLIGLVTLLGALFPVLIARRDVHFSGGFDRYTLHASPAVAILIVGLLFKFIRGQGRQIILGLLLFLGVATQVLNAYHWQRFWEDEKTLWWQLWWRAPDLKDGTVLLASVPESGFFEDYEIWGPANLIYRPATKAVTIGAEIINDDSIWEVWSGAIDYRGMRKFSYERNYNQSLLLILPSDGSCLKVVDKEDILLPLRFEPRLIPILRFSHADQIDLPVRTLTPPGDIFGSEPDHSWCYFYQRAEQSKQASDWDGVVQLGDEVISAGLRPVDRAEWLPFIEGYIWDHDSSKVEYVLGEIIADARLVKQICDTLENGQFRFGESIQKELIHSLCTE